MLKITPDKANAAYDILVRHAGALDDEMEKWTFAHAVCDEKHPCTEYRFRGNLGFGGKFRNNGNHGNVPHVDCYREHETPATVSVMLATNAFLADLFADLQTIKPM